MTGRTRRGDRKTVTADQIKEAVAAVRALKPAYEEMLDFYEKLFLAQKAARDYIDLEPLRIPAVILSVKCKEKFPLINKADFAVDIQASGALLKKICRLAAGASEVLAEAGARIADALDRETVDASALFSAVLSEDDFYLDEAAGKLAIDSMVLVFMAYESLRPSLTLCAGQLAGYLEKDTPWEKGYCPICGSPPELAVLRDSGERSLLCSFCGHEWRVPRIYCPFCGNSDQKRLHYFFVAEEEEHRVDVCDQCRRYIKTVDTRKIKRPVCFAVEQVSTLHLDMLARDQGLEGGIPLWC